MKLLPAPLLSLSLLALWVMLQGSVDPGTVMLGALVAIMVPLMTQTLRPTRVRMRRPGKVLLLIGRVFVDVIRSNFEVAWHVWFFRSHPPRTQWVVIPPRWRHCRPLPPSCPARSGASCRWTAAGCCSMSFTFRRARTLRPGTRNAMRCS